MSAAEALRLAHAAGVHVEIDGDRLLLEASAPPPACVLNVLSNHKAGILALLRTKDFTSADDWQVFFDERAGIIEFDGRAPRPWAEILARLDPARPPCDTPPTRWLQFIDDCGRFVDDGWAFCTEALGWTPLDLFGCDRAKPFARIDRAGLLWLLDGRKLLDLTPNSAIIATSSGGTLTYRRWPDDPERVLAWEATT